MIFLYQLTSFIPENCYSSNKYLFPISDACNIIKFILNTNLENTINDIVVISEQQIDDSIYEQTFINYSPYLDHYKSDNFFEELKGLDLFPKSLEMYDNEYIQRITKLINKIKIKVVTTTSSKKFLLNKYIDLHYIINYDYADSFLKELILSDIDNRMSYIYFSNKSIKLSNNNGYFIVNILDYIKINKIVSSFSEEETSPRLNDLSFLPANNFLRIFNNIFWENLIRSHTDNETSLQFICKDKLLSKMAVNYLIPNKKITTYDMAKGLPDDLDTDHSIKFDNFEKLEERDYEKLFLRLMDHNPNNFLIIESFKDIKHPYIREYKKIEFPNSEEILNNITALCIALIFESILVKKQLYKLISLINNNKLKPLLKDYGSLEDLKKVLDEFKDITVDDIYNNIGMWIYINKKFHIPDEKIEETPKDKLVISFQDNKYFIKYKNKAHGSSELIGFLYFCIAVLNSQRYRGKELETKNSPLNIRIAALTFLGNEVEIQNIKNLSYRADEQARKAIDSAFRTMKKTYSFLDNFIRLKQKTYVVSSDSECEIVINFDSLNLLL